MSRTRVLFVDDEPNIRLTMPAVLKMHGFEVTAKASVSEALAVMQSEKFDVLIADLNIGQPGDGFTVVSAMRRTQPDAVTIILTGYPAFETALQAIRSQVDDYVVKPANVRQLVEVIEHKLRNHTPTHHVPFKRASVILKESEEQVLQGWLERCGASSALSAMNLTERERLNRLPDVLDELVRMLESTTTTLSRSAKQAAVEHGRLRREQNFTIPMMLEETRLLREAIYGAIQQNLLAVDISYVITDMIAISASIDQQVQYAIEEYLKDTLAA